MTGWAGCASRGMGAVVLGSLGGVRQDAPRLVDAPHAVGRIGRTLVKVRVMSLGEVAMRPRHLERGRITRDTEDRVRIDDASRGHRPDSTWACVIH